MVGTGGKGVPSAPTVPGTGHTHRVETGPAIRLTVDGDEVEVPDDGGTLLEALRGPLGHRSAKDGCSPQGQCGCCTVLVDGQPRVSCVTPVRRVAGRTVTTLNGLLEDEVARWTDAFRAAGGSQCGFCTPGIVVRFAGRLATSPDDPVRDGLRAISKVLVNESISRQYEMVWSTNMSTSNKQWFGQ